MATPWRSTAGYMSTSNVSSNLEADDMTVVVSSAESYHNAPLDAATVAAVFGAAYSIPSFKVLEDVPWKCPYNKKPRRRKQRPPVGKRKAKRRRRKEIAKKHKKAIAQALAAKACKTSSPGTCKPG